MKYFRLIGILSLLVFSFYLTDFVTNLAISTNPLMKSIKEDWNDTAVAYELFNNSPDSYSYNIEWECIQNMEITS